MQKLDGLRRKIGAKGERRRRRLVSAVAAIAVTAAMGLIGQGPTAAAAEAGTEYWVTFPANLTQAPELTLFITGDTSTTGTVEVSGLGFSAPFSVTAGAVTSVAIPGGAQLSEVDGVQSGMGIHVTAGAKITVYGLNRYQYTTDAYLGLPADVLGTDHLVMSYSPPATGGEFAVVGTAAATTVTITPETGLSGHAAGVPYTVTLGAGDTYQFADGVSDPTGTRVASDKPVAVFGAHNCAFIPSGYYACDHLVEQMPPTSAWGKNFLSAPLATRTAGDTFRILAQADGTTVKINGATVATLDAGQFHEQIVTTSAQIEASAPVLVAQYSNGSEFDGVTSDPFMMLIPPYEQYLASYVVSTPASGFATNFINVISPTSALASVKLDGVVVPSASFTPIGSSGFSSAQLAVGLGTHSVTGSLPLGVHSYGFDSYDSYGYPGGMSFSPIATVASITVAPKTETLAVGASGCVTATVKDSNDAVVADIRVDFAVTGVNPGTGFAMTNAAGQATYCYTGTSPGSDSILATVGTLSDTAAKTWTAANAAPSAGAGGPYTGTEGSAISIAGTASDPDGDTLTTTWSVTPGAGTDAGASCSIAAAGSLSTTVTCTDDGQYALKLSVSDGNHPPVESSTTITVANANPVVTITSPADLAQVQVGASVTVTAPFTDAGANDTHSCVVDWGDGSTTSGVVAGGVCTASHTYSAIGVPTVTVTVTDDDSGVGTATIGLVVVDQATKVTGGGFLVVDGRTSFGFVAKSTGTGFAGQIQVRAPGKDRFHGSTVSALTSSGNTATFSGGGRWNKADGHTYTVSVVDNGKGSGAKKTPDTITLTIRDSGGSIVYQVSGPLKGGNITVH